MMCAIVTAESPLIEPNGTALVTGASSGIGASFVRRLAADGWNLVLVARRESRLVELSGELEELGVTTEMLVADLAEPRDLERVASRVAAEDIGMLINCAGINGFGPAHQVEPELLTRLIAINVTAPTLLARAALPGMLARDSGFIINVSSRLAFASPIPPAGVMPYRSAYAGSKGYLVTLTRTLATELAGTGVTVQVLCPPLTATEFHLTDGSSVVSDEIGDSDVPGMAADAVAAGSLAALAAGEAICLPSLEDPAKLVDYLNAEAAMRDNAAGPLASRYGSLD
jgi:short-subunit dehydrogenase